MGLFGGDFTLADVQRLKRVEEKLDLLLLHFGLSKGDAGTVGPSETVRDLADRGEKIAAIKQYRDETGAGLAEAKTAIERYMGGG